jgi:hypothetical protein
MGVTGGVRWSSRLQRACGALPEHAKAFNSNGALRCQHPSLAGYHFVEPSLDTDNDRNILMLFL